ncbi:MAG: CDP-glycerol glycerophosphotransferase family protein [Bacteroidales bacterium]|nr:CDP-glycerol glycerophosphotransferase family protein [Bacteroidales bacterium]
MDILISSFFFVLYCIKKIQFECFFRKKNHSVGLDILFSNDSAFWRKYIHSNGSSYKDDITLSDVISEAKNRDYKINCIDIGIPRRSYKRERDKFKEDTDWLCIEQFVTMKNLFNALFLTYRRLLSIRSKKKDLLLLGLWGQTKNTFRNYFCSFTAEKVIEYLNPKLIIMGCEYLYISRALTYVAKQNNIPVFAVQHGDLSLQNHGFFFPDNELELMKKRIPDYTFVFSKTVKEILTEYSIYKNKNIVITGNPRYDLLEKPELIYNKHKIMKNYDIPENKTKILWTPCCRYISDQENIKILKALELCSYNIENSIIIIKRHPNDGTKYTRMIKHYLKLPNERFIMLPQKSDTNSLIYCCDILVTMKSSTTTEAVILNKPVIELTLESGVESSVHVKSGVAVTVVDEKQLAPTIEKILLDDSKLVSNRKYFIKDHLYRIDGKAAERVVNFIDKIIRN